MPHSAHFCETWAQDFSGLSRGEHTLPDADSFELFIKPLQTLAGHVAYDFSDYQRWCGPQLFLFQVELDHQLEQWWRKGETFSTLLPEFQSE